MTINTFLGISSVIMAAGSIILFLFNITTFDNDGSDACSTDKVKEAVSTLRMAVVLALGAGMLFGISLHNPYDLRVQVVLEKITN